MKFRDNIGEIGSFAMPVFLEQSSMAIMSVVGTILISTVSTEALSGVNMVDAMAVLIQQIFLSLEIGALVVVAQYCGRGDNKSAGEASVQAMLTSVGIALFLCAFFLIFPDLVLNLLLGRAEASVYAAGKLYFRYVVFSFPFLSVYAITMASLRGSGSPRMSLVGVIVTNVMYGLCGLVFIKVFDLGIVGIGMAMIIARFCGAATGVLLLTRGKGKLTITRWIPKKIDWDIQKSVLLIGIPACIENLIFTGGRLITQTYTVPLGTHAMATNALSNSIAMFYNIPGNTATAISIPIVGKYLGMRNTKSAIEVSRVILVLSTIALTLLSLIMFFFARPIAGIFTTEKDIIDGIVFIIKVNLIVTPFLWTFSFVVPAILRSAGDIKFTTSVSVTSMVLFRMTIGYLLAITLGFGVIGIWIGMYVDWFVRGLFFATRYVKGKWLYCKVISDKQECDI